MFCVECGAQIQTDGAFCAICGAFIERQPAKQQNQFDTNIKTPSDPAGGQYNPDTLVPSNTGRGQNNPYIPTPASPVGGQYNPYVSTPYPPVLNYPMTNANKLDVDSIGRSTRNRNKGVGIAAGIVAIISALYNAFRIYNSIIMVFIPQIIYQLFAIAAMVMCAIYAFAVYGKKQSTLLGISAIAIVAGAVSGAINELLIIIRYSSFSSLLDIGIGVILIHLDILFCVLFIMVAIGFFKHNANSRIKVLIIIVAAVSAFQSTFSIIYYVISMSRYNDNMLEYILIDIIHSFFGLLYLVPFLLFALSKSSSSQSD